MQKIYVMRHGPLVNSHTPESLHACYQAAKELPRRLGVWTGFSPEKVRIITSELNRAILTWEAIARYFDLSEAKISKTPTLNLDKDPRTAVVYIQARFKEKLLLIVTHQPNIPGLVREFGHYQAGAGRNFPYLGGLLIQTAPPLYDTRLEFGLFVPDRAGS